MGGGFGSSRPGVGPGPVPSSSTGQVPLVHGPHSTSGVVPGPVPSHMENSPPDRSLVGVFCVGSPTPAGDATPPRYSPLGYQGVALPTDSRYCFCHRFRSFHDVSQTTPKMQASPSRTAFSNPKYLCTTKSTMTVHTARKTPTLAFASLTRTFAVDCACPAMYPPGRPYPPHSTRAPPNVGTWALTAGWPLCWPSARIML